MNLIAFVRPAGRRTSKLCTSLTLALLAAVLSLPAAPPPTLSSNALQEITALLREKAGRTPAQLKMESQLIHALKQSRGEPFAAGAPNLRLDVKPEADGRVLVDINADVDAALLNLITRDGGEVINQFPQFHAIRALATLSQLETVAGAAGVHSIRRAARWHANTGSVDSEGDTTHRALAARAAFGATGAGVKVGVLSDSVDFLSNSQASGDLGTVTVLSGQSGVPASGEGTAMLEIIHDLAPGAQLFFATANTGEAAFAQNILNLRANGCDIIVDDISYFDESPFQDGVVAQAVNTVTAGGALYFSAAGNSGNLDSGASATWEGDFADGGATAGNFPESGRLHRFGSTFTYNSVLFADSGSHVDLFWSDPAGASANDYDLFILDSTGTTVVASSTGTQDGTQDPYESVSALNTGERIVIVQFKGAGRFLHLNTGDAVLSLGTAGANVGHSAATNAFCVAAVDAATAYPNAFFGGSGNPVENFSSDGPRHVFYNADGSAMTPGNLSSTGGAIRLKPDLAAADGVATSVSGFASFFGTSAAAPHAAAIAALLKSYNPALKPAQIRALLTSTTLDIMASGWDRNAGAGIVMADTVLGAAPPGALLITPGTGFSATGLPAGPFSVTSQNLTLTNNGGAVFNWSLASTSAWLSVSPSGGTLTPGGAAATITASLAAGASNLTAGVYSARVWFTNLASGLAQDRDFTLSVTTTAGGEGAYPNAVLALAPVAYWRLNEVVVPAGPDVVTNSGTLGAAGNGLGAGGVLQGQAGIVGGSSRFSNPSMIITYLGSRVDVPYTPGLNPNGPFTVEFWVKPAQLPTDLFCPAASIDASQNGGISRSGWIFYQTNTLWNFWVGGLNGYAAKISGGATAANAWHHIAGVYDGANISLYVNGQLAGGPAPVSGFNANTVAPLRLGATTIPNRTYDGWVDEAAFYTSALPASIIAAHYSAAATNNGGYRTQILAANPAGYWRLEEPAFATPTPGTLPLAANAGTLAPVATGVYQPGSLPGAAGAPGAGQGPGNSGCQTSGGYLAIPGQYLNLTGPLTLLAWTRANAAGGVAQTIFSKGVESFRLTMDGSGFPHFADGSQPGGDLIGPARIDDGQWHFLAGTFNGVNTESLYVDGQPAAASTGATTAINGNTDDVWIGGDPGSGTPVLFNGIVDEPAILTNALSAAQVLQLYNAASTPLPAPPSIMSVVPVAGPGGSALRLSWSSIAGQRYQVQYKTDLGQSAWSGLVIVPATGATTTATDAAPSGSGRFYRIALLP